jgi:predicted nucleic acid-binding protein
MLRVCWDTNPFIYLLESNALFLDRVRYLWQQHALQGDDLCASQLVLGELMVGPRTVGNHGLAEIHRDYLLDSGVRILTFDMVATDTYSKLRAASRVSTPDAINLACAAAEGVDLFITNDKDLPKLTVPGIGKIVGLYTDLI